jgi:hypothetical protein
MALETTTTTKTTKTPMEEAFLRKLLPETIPPAAAAGNPVDVILALRKDMAALQKVGGDKQAFRENLRATMKAACMEALLRANADAVANAAAREGDAADRRRRPNDGSGAAAAAADCPNGLGYLNIEPIVEYLQERRAIRPKLSRAKIRRLAKRVLAEQAKKESSEKESSKGDSS